MFLQSAKLIPICLAVVLTALSTTESIASNCTFTLVWAHGETKTLKAANGGEFGKNFILQSCGAKDRSTIETAIYQGFQNGHERSNHHPGINGGLNPIMSSQNDPRTRFNPDRIAEFEELELLKMKELSEQSTSGLSDSEIKKIVMATGFVRLTQYHWASVLKHASEAVESGRCQRATVRFTCYGRIADEQKMLYQRFNLAAGLTVPIPSDRKLLVDRDGNSIFIERKSCGQDSIGRPIQTLPAYCEEIYTIRKATTEQLPSTPCGEMMSKVRPGYNTRVGGARPLLDLYTPGYCALDRAFRDTWLIKHLMPEDSTELRECAGEPPIEVITPDKTPPEVEDNGRGPRY